MADQDDPKTPEAKAEDKPNLKPAKPGQVESEEVVSTAGGSAISSRIADIADGDR